MGSSFAPDALHSGRERASVGLALLVLALVVSASGWLTRIDHFVFDLAQRLQTVTPPQGVVLVGIDQTSLQNVGRWPWPRQTQARLLQQICQSQPQAVAVDIAFNEGGDDKAGNAALAQALRSCGKVALPVLMESSHVGGQALEAMPIPELAQAAAGLGRVSVRLDDDGVARGVDLWEGVGNPAWPLLAQVVLQLSGWHAADQAHPSDPASSSDQPYAIVRREPRLLHFVGPLGTVPSVSAVDVLQSSAPLPTLRGQIVLVGATAAGLGDLLPTPVTTAGAPMPGVEVLANVLLNLRDQRFIQPVALPWTLFWSAVLAVVPLLWATRLMPLPGLLASFAWFGTLLLASLTLPLLFHVWLAPSGAMVAAISVYPLWSWRRLETARRHLDWELQQLAGSTSADPLLRLGFEQRIAYVQQAQARFRDLQLQRDETLAFFSHDIRAPLASAAQQLAAGALNEASQQRLVLQLRRAHELAQGFLSLIRAKNLEPAALREIELGSVLHQAADAVYELAQTQGQRVQRDIPDEPVWVSADFALLERAVSNLLHNALRHAPADSVIVLALRLEPSSVLISVSDQGQGVSSDVLPQLFQRFAHDGAQARQGSSTGLGLYFVHTVALRLGGEAGYEALKPQGARFWLRLPRLQA